MSGNRGLDAIYVAHTDPAMMRLSTGRPSYVTSSSSLRGQPPISHPPQRPQIRSLPPAHTMANSTPRASIAVSSGFRTGSIVTGFPRYQARSLGWRVVFNSLILRINHEIFLRYQSPPVVTTATPALSLTRHTVSQQNPTMSQNGGGPRYYQREN